MIHLPQLKNLLKDRETAEINTFVDQHPLVLSETDAAGVSGLMYIAYHQLPDALANAIIRKKDFTLPEAAAMGLLHRVITEVHAQPNAVNQAAKDGFYPLTLACFFGHFSVAAYLIKKGAMVNLPAANPTHVTPLHSAVARNDFDLCNLLIKNGADVNAQQTAGVTALHSAAHRGNLKLVKLLIENGALINNPTEDGKTALDFAQQDGQREVAAFLSSQAN